MSVSWYTTTGPNDDHGLHKGCHESQSVSAREHRTKCVKTHRYYRIYPAIDPTKHFEGKTYKGKVVLVTGASRGIGQDVARHYALAGASVTLVSRRQAALEDVKAAILLEIPDADVLLYAADVKDPVQAEAAVNATVERFGRLDVLIANAGVSTPFTQSTYSCSRLYTY